MPALNPLPTNKATEAQVNYILILLNDVGLDRERGLAHLKDIAKKSTLNAVGDLTKFEASLCIGKLKEWKENASD